MIPLVRKKGGEGIFWDPAEKKANHADFERFDAVIHLCGANIASHRWTKKRKELLFASRVESTQFLTKLLLEVRALPQTVITVSAVGYYGDCGEEVGEEGEKGKGFSPTFARRGRRRRRRLSLGGSGLSIPVLGSFFLPKEELWLLFFPFFTLALGRGLGSGETEE